MRRLRFTKLSGESLVPQDGETCDPYVVVTIGKKQFRTPHVVKNHLNPRFDCSGFEFSWDEVSPLPTITFDVFDHDMGPSDDFIGCATVQLQRSMLGEHMSVMLAPGKDESGDLQQYESLGKIVFAISMDDDKTASAHQQPGGRGSPSPYKRSASGSTNIADGSGGAEYGAGARSTGSPARRVQAQLLRTSPGDRQWSGPCTVFFSSLRIDNLPVEDSRTVNTEVFVQVKIDSVAHASEAVSCHDQTYWQCLRELAFSWDGKSAMPAAEFSLFGGSPSQLLGFSHTQLHPAMIGTEAHVNLGAKGSTSTNRLSRYGSLGTLFFVLDYRDSSASPHRNTSSGYRTREPSNNVEYVSDDQAQPAQHHAGSTNQDPYGRSTIRSPTNQRPRKGVAPQRTASGNRFKPTDVFQQSQMNHSGSFNRHQQQQPEGITLKIVEARNLLGRDVKGNSDPYVVIFAEGASQKDLQELDRTAIVRNTREPRWNETFRFTDLDSGCKMMRVAVFDNDPYGDHDFLGFARFPLPRDPSPHEAWLQLLPRPNHKDDERVLSKARREDFGSLKIVISGTNPVQGSDLSGSNSRVNSPNDSRGGQYPPRARSPVGARGPSSASQNDPRRQQGMVSSTNRPGFAPKLHVNVLSATNLPFPCESYVMLRFEGTTKSNRAHPAHQGDVGIYNYKTAFDCFSGREELHLYADVRVANTDEVIGASELKFSRTSVYKQFTTTAPLLPISQRGEIMYSEPTVGELTLILHYEPGEDKPSTRPTTIDRDASLRLCVVRAEALGESRDSGLLNPYAIVSVLGQESEVEYRSSTVRATSNPIWYFQIPDQAAHSNDAVIVTLWNEESFGFDEFLGMTRLNVGAFTRQTTGVTLQLEPRASDNPEPGRKWGKIKLEWSVERRPQRTVSAAPKVLEVGVISANNLVSSLYNSAIVRVSCDDQPSAELRTKAVPKNTAQWDELLQLNIDGMHNKLRFTVWDSDTRDATFLGEYVKPLSTTEAGEYKEFLMDLRPRSDAHCNADDLALLNKTQHGFGALKFSLKAYSIQEYEARMRERLQSRGDCYNLFVQVVEAADVPQRGKYFVRIKAGGIEKSSHVEDSHHPKFRKNFDFLLHYETEVVSLALLELYNDEPYLVGEVTFPVNAPDRVGVEPITAWLKLKETNNDTLDHPGETRILVRWRTIRSDSNASNRQQQQQQQQQGAFDSSFSNNQQGGAVDPDMSALRDEVQALRNELTSLRRGAAPGGNSAAVGYGFNLNVYCPQYSRVTKYVGTAQSTIVDVIASTVRELGLRNSDDYCLVLHGRVLPPGDFIESYVNQGETVFMVGKETLSADQQRSYAPQHQGMSAFASPMPAYGAVAPGSGMATPRGIAGGGTGTGAAAVGSRQFQVSKQVIERIAKYGIEVNVVTAVVTVLSPPASPVVTSLLQICVSYGVNGFARPLSNNMSSTEVFVQSAPAQLSQLLQEVLDSSASQVIIEEVKGYIPIMNTFRAARDMVEGAHMFEYCSTPYNPETGEVGKCWFYKATDSTYPAIGVRYVDERA